LLYAARIHRQRLFLLNLLFVLLQARQRTNGSVSIAAGKVRPFGDGGLQKLAAWSVESDVLRVCWG